MNEASSIPEPIPALADRPWTPARTAPVSSQIVSQVRGALFRGELTSGQFLGSERELASRFGASRGTVRTALRTLEALGIVDIKVGAGGGVRIAQGNPDRFADALAVQFHLVGVRREELLDAQSAIECAAAELAALSATPSEIEKMGSLIEEARSTIENAPRSSALGLAFHLAVAEAAHNRALSTQLKALRYQMWPENDQRPTGDVAERILAAHRQILERIAAGDAAGAKQAMREHLDSVRAAQPKDKSDTAGASCC